MRKKLKHIFVTVVTATNPATLTAAVSENVSYNSFIVSINWKAFTHFLCYQLYIYVCQLLFNPTKQKETIK